MYTCTCDEFLDNIDQVIMALIFYQSSSGHHYNAKHFSHCPWCGKELIKVKSKIQKKPKKLTFLKRLFS